MSSYTKINLIITVEVFLLCLIGHIIKWFIYPEFDIIYIVVAQLSLIPIQVICLILYTRDYDITMKELKKLTDELYK